MRFAHMADCHIGGWRDPRMKDLPLNSFVSAINRCIEKNVDFLLISGDLFNSSHPPIDNLKTVVKKLRELKEKDIAVYMVAGSHDFSASGKTIIDVLEEAGLAKNVVKGEIIDEKLKLRFTIDKKTGAKITGMLGKKGSLERKFYSSLDLKPLENEEGFKIFMFHTCITELKPKDLEKMESSPISLLPKGFDYYAGGHIHIVEKVNLEGYKNVVYPGPIFPNSFKELEGLKAGSFYIYDNGELIPEKIYLYNVESFRFDATNKTPESLTAEILSAISRKEFVKSIVLVRVEGKLKSGKTTDIDFSRIFKTLYAKGAYFVMRNTSRLESEDFTDIQVKEDSVEKIEEKLIEEHRGKSDSIFDDGKEAMKMLMSSFSQEKNDGEKTSEYDKRISDEINKILKI